MPQPPRPFSAHRALLAVVLPPLLVLGALLTLGVLSFLHSRQDTASTLIPSVPQPATGQGTTGAPATTVPTGTGPGPSGSAGATTGLPAVTATTAREQAEALDGLLDESARAPVAASVLSLARCSPSSVDAGTVAAAVRHAESTRADLLLRLARIPVDALPDGPSLRTSLTDTWTQWVDADRQYLTWAEGIAQGSSCNPQDPFKLAGDVAAAAAGRSGTDFVAAWNAKVAGPLHLTPRHARDL